MEKFTKMILIEAVTGDFNLQDIVKAKTMELDKRKPVDDVTNYRVIENKVSGEYLLDFVMSEGSIVEWNAYRYRKLNEKAGKKGIMIFAYSRRAYGSATTKFLEGLKQERPADINALAAYKIPIWRFNKKLHEIFIPACFNNCTECKFTDCCSTL